MTNPISMTDMSSLGLDSAVVTKAVEMAGSFAVNLVIALIIFVITVLASRWAAAATRRALSRVRGFKQDPTIQTFTVQVVRLLVLVVGLIAVLQRLGVQTTSIIAVLGAASLAVGLALQGTLSNVAAGVMLLVGRPYRVGDLVDIGGQVGTVQKLGLFVTQMTNANNVKIVVPNSKVFGDTILNLSGQKKRRIELLIGVSYGSNLNQTKALLVRVAEDNPSVLEVPAPWVGVTNLLDSSVEMTVHAWVKSPDYFQTKADILQAAKEALDEAGIEIPYPHQVAVPFPGTELDPVTQEARPMNTDKAPTKGPKPKSSVSKGAKGSG